MLSQKVGAPAFSLLHRIPLCKCTRFLIHTFADGHLGCFRPLATVNGAAMNIGVYRFFWIGVSGAWVLSERFFCSVNNKLFEGHTLK